MTSSFQSTLAEHQVDLLRGKTEILQINVGRACNLACKHCHLDAGPGRPELMDRSTMQDVCDFAERFPFTMADITGGAPELAPDLPYLLGRLATIVDKVILRTNLTLLLEARYERLLDLCCEKKIVLIASFPSTNKSQTDAQRGDGVWQQSLDMLKKLNDMGYGMQGSDLELSLVSNPAGAFMPADQCQAEKKIKQDLARRWDLHFNNLYTFANIPLGRFRVWLEKSGNLEDYLRTLSDNFNPATIPGLMCRNLISVSWEGYLFDCDFNLAADRPYSGTALHVTDINALPEGTPILTGDYCYGCTAGAGFT